MVISPHISTQLTKESNMEEFWVAFGMQTNGLAGKHVQSGMLTSKEKAVEWAKDCLSKNLGVQEVSLMRAEFIVKRHDAPITVLATLPKVGQSTTKKPEELPLPLPRSLDADIVF
jgi:hypothetical protein